MAITIPKPDAHTAMQFWFTDKGLQTATGNQRFINAYGMEATLKSVGNPERNIEKDSKFGYAFRGNSSARWYGYEDLFAEKYTIEVYFQIDRAIPNGKYSMIGFLSGPDPNMRKNGSYNGRWGNKSFPDHALARGMDCEFVDGKFGICSSMNGSEYQHEGMKNHVFYMPIGQGLHSFAFCCTSGHMSKFFVDGRLVFAPSTEYFPCFLESFTIGHGGYSPLGNFCKIQFIRISDNDRYPGNYNTEQPFNPEKYGFARATTPINFAGMRRFDGFNVLGDEPASTKRRLIFQVDNSWKKLVVTNGTASLQNVATQAPTAQSIIAQGNTPQEVMAARNIPGFVNKQVYPAVALYTSSSAKPTAYLTCNWI